MLRVMFLPIDYNDFRQDGFAKAFVHFGCHVHYFDYFGYWNQSKKVQNVRGNLINMALNFKPDVFFIQTHHLPLIDAESVRKIKNVFPKCKFCNWTQDVNNYMMPNFLEMSKVCEFNFACSTGQLKFLSEGIGKSVYYLNTGYDQNLYFPSKEKKTSFTNDIVFTGNYDSKSSFPGAKERMQAAILLKKTFGDRFKLHGSSWPAEVKTEGHYNQRELNTLYHDSVCCLSISHYNEIADYFSDRLLRCMASGRPTICYRFPNWQNYFTDMSDIVIVNSIEEIPEKVNMLKNNPDLADFIGRNGAAKVLAEHTYITRVKQLFDVIGIKT